jgi:transposase-like protein
MGIMNELKNRGVRDILLAAVDGLTGFPDAIAAVFPKTEVQLCMVHMVRNSVRFVPYKDRKAVTAGLKKIYLSPSAELAAAALDEFAEVWNTKYPIISRSWRNRWNEVIPFFKFSPKIRKAVYTANAIEPVNYTIQKIIKHRQSFPNDKAAMKLMFMLEKHIPKMNNADTGLGDSPQRRYPGASSWVSSLERKFIILSPAQAGSWSILRSGGPLVRDCFTTIR